MIISPDNMPEVFHAFLQKSQDQWDSMSRKRIERLWGPFHYSIDISIASRSVARTADLVGYPGFKLMVHQKMGQPAFGLLVYDLKTVLRGVYRMRRPEDFLQTADAFIKTFGVPLE